jgi:hypothetical protein
VNKYYAAMNAWDGAVEVPMAYNGLLKAFQGNQVELRLVGVAEASPA